MAVIIRLVCLMRPGLESDLDGLYVAAYDPTFHPAGEDYDGGLLEVTDDPAKALQFEDAGEALRKWRQPYGIREDGEPNRPLTAWLIEIDKAPALAEA